LTFVQLQVNSESDITMLQFACLDIPKRQVRPMSGQVLSLTLEFCSFSFVLW